MTDVQIKKAKQMLEEGKSYRVIAEELGDGLTWNDIQTFAWDTNCLSWQGAKKAISLRLKQFPLAGTQADRERLATEIDEYVEYLYASARKVQDKVDSARRVLE